MKITPKKFIFNLLGLCFIAFSIWSFFIEPNQLIVKNHNLKLKKWSPKLNGFKIVTIADIHAGSNFIYEEKIRQIVSLTNEQKADIIILLGDYLSPQFFNRKELKMSLDSTVKSLSGLQAKYGVYVVLGNHDNEFGHEKVRREFEQIGYQVLENEAVVIEKDNEKLKLLGLGDVLQTADPLDYPKNFKDALDKIDEPTGNIIAFTHNPDMVEFLSSKFVNSDNFSLFIAGHTHGGQCNFPVIGAPIVPSSFGQKYVGGFVRQEGVDIFVTTGIGTSIIPIRFRVPPEISVLTLVQE
jgi:uncharacterized protein